MIRFKQIHRMIKIFHYADVQVEIRPTPLGNRHDEFAHALGYVEQQIEKENPDFVLLLGDLSQFAQITGDESDMLSAHISRICARWRLIIIPGNHDIKQRNNAIEVFGETCNTKDNISSIVTSVKSANLRYFKETGIYEFGGINWAVWSQYAKFDVNGKASYSPWANGDDLPDRCIELFHDPINICTDWDGSVSPIFSNEGGMDQFKAHTVLAGDIHIPQILDVKGTRFVYSSSLVTRDFGEGDYYQNNVIYQLGNTRHGYMIHEVDETTGKTGSSKFHAVPQLVARHTIKLDEAFTKDDITTLELVTGQSSFHKIRVEFESNVNGIVACADLISEHLKSKYNCSIEYSYSKSLLCEKVDDGVNVSDIQSLFDPEVIREIGHKFIEATINKTPTISATEKVEAIDILTGIFDAEIKNLNFSNIARSINLNHATSSNFMTFGDSVYIPFEGLGLTRIGGTNGVGKTTAYTFIGWMFTDIVSRFLPKTKKKYNRCLLFNKNRPNDIVEGALNFTVDGVVWDVEKTVTREWDKGGNVYLQDDWMEHIKGTPQQTLKITKNGVLFSEDYETCQTTLSELMAYEEFVMMLFVNREHLDSLLKCETDELNRKILKTLGLNIFDNMSDRMDEVVETKMKTLNNHKGITLDDIVSKIAAHNETLDTLSETITTKTESLETIKSAVLVIDKEIGSIRETLHQVDDVYVINAKIVEINANQEKVNAVIETLTAKITNLREEQSKGSAEILETIKTAERELAEYNGDLKTLNARKEGAIKRLEGKKSEQKTYCAAYVVERNKSKSEIETSKANKETKLAKISVSRGEYVTLDNDRRTVATKIRTDRNQVLKDEVNDAKLKLANVNNAQSNKIVSLSMAKQKLADKKEDKETFKNSLICSECGKVLDETEESKIHFEKRIGDFELEIFELTNSVTECEKQIESGKLLVNEAKKKVVDCESTLDLFVTELISENYLTTDELNKYDDLQDAEIEIKNEIKDYDVLLLNYTFDKTINKIKADKTYLAFVDEISAIEKETNESDVTILESISKSEAKVLSVAKDKEAFDSIGDRIQTENEKLTQLTARVATLAGDMKLTIEHHTQATKNVEIKKSIDEKLRSKELLVADIEQTTNEIESVKVRGVVAKNEIVRLNEQTADVKKYQLYDAVMKQYRLLLSKKGLPRQIFHKIAGLLNNELTETLDGLDFRLAFNSDTLALEFIDLNKMTISPVVMISGMECTFSGLALFDTISRNNQTNRYSHLFIDELSGTLNDGKDVSYQSIDYKQKLADVLAKLSKRKKVMVVDHVLENLGESRVFEFQKTTDGSIINIKELF